MPAENAAPPAVPPATGGAAPATPAPKNEFEYRAAAIAAMEAAEKAAPAEPPVEAAAAPPAGEPAPDAPKEPLAVAAPPGAPEEPPAAKEGEPPKSKLELRALTAVARANRQLREREEALKRREAEFKPPSKPMTAMEALTAAGFTYEQATHEVVTGKPSAPRAPEAPKEDPALAAVQKELKEVREQMAQQQERASRAEVMGTLAQVVAKDADAFELVARYANHPKLHAYNRVLEVLQEHFNNTGQPPGATWEESLRIGAEYVEKELEEQILAPGLTAKKVRGRLVHADPKREPVGGPRAKPGQQPPTTLTNAAVSGAPPRSGPLKPRTDEEYRRAAIAVLERGT